MNQQVKAYAARNLPWLRPVLLTMMILGSGLVISVLQPAEQVVPRWAVALTLILGGVSAGIGAFQANTISSRIAASLFAIVGLVILVIYAVDQFF